MTNEHNPIAIRINRLQDQWIEGRKIKPTARIIRWLVTPDDVPLVNGFYKLESSVHGKIEEGLVVLLTNFEDADIFSYHLAKDWLEMYEKDLKKYPQLDWKDFSKLKEQFLTLDQKDRTTNEEFFVDLLKSFKEYEGNSKTLFIGINPRKVWNHQEMNDWCMQFFTQLPENIGLVLTDHKGKGYHDSLFANLGNQTQTLVLKDQDMRGAYQALATQGNPNDPQVAFRKCMMEMGNCAAKNDKKGVDKWGQKALEVTQKTGQKPFWMSAHLVYAGFLFGFKDSTKINQLLDKAIQIGKPKMNSDQATAGLILQLYSYKAAYYSIDGKYQKAFDWFVKQAELSIEQKQDMLAVGAYKNALLVASQNNMKQQLLEILPTAFDTGYKLDDTNLKTTEFAFTAKHYLEAPLRIDANKTAEIEARMIELFGKKWRDIAKHTTNNPSLVAV